MPGSATFQVNVSNASGNTNSNPPILPVREKKGTSITVNWVAQGNNTFPSTDFFSWKNSTNPGTLPSRSSDGKTLTLTYSMSGTVTWSYNIKLEGCVQEDPDIENEIPPGGGGEEEDPPRGTTGQPGGGQPGGGQPGGGQPGGGQPGGGQPGSQHR